MKSIKVDKKTLIETITRNRDEHREMFLKAQEKYRNKVIELLDDRLKQMRDGKTGVDLVVRLPEPVDYTASYDTVLQMLEWEKRDEVELSQEQFERYVENNWEWRHAWAQNTGSYLAQ